MKMDAIFEVDGERYTYADMIAANADDDGLCSWLRTAQVGDVFPAFVPCTRVA